MTGVATIVVDEAITRLEALDAVARLSEVAVSYSGTTRASVVLSPSTRARIDIPKFGEAPPLAIDVESDVDAADARREAIALAERLHRFGWRAALDDLH